MKHDVIQSDFHAESAEHTDEFSAPIPNSSKFCNESFARETELHSHEQNTHKFSEEEGGVQKIGYAEFCEESIWYPCEICSRRFKTNFGLQAHRRDSHESKESSEDLKFANDRKIHPCNFCRRVFKSPIGLQAHQRDSHPTIESNLITKSTDESLRQEKEESNFSPVPVPISRFASSPITKAVFTVPCDICCKLFRSSLDLHAHQRDAHNLIQPEDLLSSEAPIPCTQCRRVYKTMFGLRAHERDAHGVDSLWVVKNRNILESDGKTIKLPNGTVTSKHIPCGICAKVFRTDRNLQLHVKTVHSGTKINCEFCGKYLTSLVAMEQHIKAKHVIQDFKVVDKIG